MKKTKQYFNEIAEKQLRDKERKEKREKMKRLLNKHNF